MKSGVLGKKKSHFPHGDQPKVPKRSKVQDIPILVATFDLRQDVKNAQSFSVMSKLLGVNVLNLFVDHAQTWWLKMNNPSLTTINLKQEIMAVKYWLDFHAHITLSVIHYDPVCHYGKSSQEVSFRPQEDNRLQNHIHSGKWNRLTVILKSQKQQRNATER